MTTPNAVTREDILRIAYDYGRASMRYAKHVDTYSDQVAAREALEAAITQLCDDRDELRACLNAAESEIERYRTERDIVCAERDEWKQKAEDALEVLDEYPREI